MNRLPNGIIHRAGFNLRPLLLLILATMISGCMPIATPEQIAAADIVPAPYDAQDQIKKAMYDLLIDPTVPLYDFKPPYKDYSNRTGAVIYGWRLDYRLNSKNRFGGYTGSTDYTAFFADGKLQSIQSLGGTDNGQFIYLAK